MATPAQVQFSPLALVDYGLSAFSTTSGIGLVTRGFEWGYADIWELNYATVVTTIWVPATDFGNYV